MQFCFYPNHEHGCPHVSHCPHLGGAALGTLVNLATENQQERQALLRTVDAQREQIARLVAETQRLEGELKQARLELKLERQGKFATHQQEQSEGSAATTVPSPAAKQGKKRGAPVGHPGWFRPTPAEYDWMVEVPAPGCCPLCPGPVTVQRDLDPLDHLQEDLIDGVYRVVLYRHAAACCDKCGERVRQPGEGELLGSRIGPRLRSTALYLRHVIGISYRKVPQAIQELFGITFTPGALIGFEKLLARLAEPVVADIAKKLDSSDGAVTLQARIIHHHAEWLVFVDDPRVPPTNSLAERALRPLVVLRKLTFGHRSRSGGERMAKLMSVAETARRHGHRASRIFLDLQTHPPNDVLRRRTPENERPCRPLR